MAREAGLSKAAVYLYFPSKRALLAGLVRRAVAPVADLALHQIADYRGDPRPVIAGVMQAMVARLADPAALAVPGLVLREAAVAPEMVQVYREEVLDRVLPAVQALLAQGVAGGFIRKVDPELTLRSIVGPVMLHVMMAQVFGIVPEGGLQMDRLVENHLSILFQGLEPEEAA